jgi:hypothetical protein
VGWTLIDDPGTIDHDHSVCPPGKLQAVSDEHGRTIPHDGLVPLDDLTLRHRIERCRGFIQNENRGIGQESPGHRDPLAFTRGNRQPAIPDRGL